MQVLQIQCQQAKSIYHILNSHGGAENAEGREKSSHGDTKDHEGHGEKKRREKEERRVHAETQRREVLQKIHKP